MPFSFRGPFFFSRISSDDPKRGLPETFRSSGLDLPDPKLCGLRNRNVSPHNSGGQELRIKLSMGLAASESVRENLFRASGLGPGGCLAIFGAP